MNRSRRVQIRESKTRPHKTRNKNNSSRILKLLTSQMKLLHRFSNISGTILEIDLFMGGLTRTFYREETQSLGMFKYTSTKL